MEGQLSTTGTDDTTRERLWAAAVELFNAKGFTATTVREIAEAAGVTKPVVYYYFGSKEGIYLDIMEHAFAHMEELAERSRSGSGSSFDRLRSFLEDAYDIFEEHIPEARLIFAAHYGPPQGAPEFDHEAFHEKFAGSVQAIVEDGVATGQIRPGHVEETVNLVLGILDLAMEMRLIEPERATGRDGLRRLLRLAFDGIASGRDIEFKE